MYDHSMTTGRPIGRRGVGGNVKKINGEWLKAVDSKSTVPLWYRGVRIPPSPSCTIDVYLLWSGAGIETGEVRERSNRRAWRARGRQKCPVGSNPTLSAQAGALRVLVPWTKGGRARWGGSGALYPASRYSGAEFPLLRPHQAELPP